MKINAETKYCQTCGIPLDIDYTNLEANQNVEYCDFCFHLLIFGSRLDISVLNSSEVRLTPVSL